MITTAIKANIAAITIPTGPDIAANASLNTPPAFDTFDITPRSFDAPVTVFPKAIITGPTAAAPAAIGATSEDPKVFGKALIFVALGEGIALYGLLISILILNKVA